jgi:hypothetical protein
MKKNGVEKKIGVKKKNDLEKLKEFKRNGHLHYLLLG